jgi:hypothetical protein
MRAGFVRGDGYAEASPCAGMIADAESGGAAVSGPFRLCRSEYPCTPRITLPHAQKENKNREKSSISRLSWSGALNPDCYCRET